MAKLASKCGFFSAAGESLSKTLGSRKLSSNWGGDVYFSGLPYLASHLVAADGSEGWSHSLLDARRSAAMKSGDKSPKCLFLGATERILPEYLEFFSQIEATGRAEEALRILRLLEPALRRIALLVVEGEASLYGDVGRGRLVPLTFMGEGMRSVLAVLLAITNATEGYVLVDEIENGLHYSVMKDVWKAIGQAARAANVQVFATTHSWECVRYAHEAFSEDGPYDLRLHRLDRVGEEIQVATYAQDSLGYATEMSHEVR
jgi:hypothetical protein